MAFLYEERLFRVSLMRTGDATWGMKGCWGCESWRQIARKLLRRCWCGKAEFSSLCFSSRCFGRIIFVVSVSALLVWPRAQYWRGFRHDFLTSTPEVDSGKGAVLSRCALFLELAVAAVLSILLPHNKVITANSLLFPLCAFSRVPDAAFVITLSPVIVSACVFFFS